MCNGLQFPVSREKNLRQPLPRGSFATPGPQQYLQCSIITHYLQSSNGRWTHTKRWHALRTMRPYGRSSPLHGVRPGGRSVHGWVTTVTTHAAAGCVYPFLSHQKQLPIYGPLEEPEQSIPCSRPILAETVPHQWRPWTTLL